MKREQGFTLIELLVVISIIGLLASVVLVALNSARSKSRDAKRIADMNQIAKAMELYFNSCDSYPVVTASTTLTNSMSVFLGTAANCGDNGGASPNGGIGSTLVGTKISGLSAAPTPADSTTCATGSNNSYSYRSYENSVMTDFTESNDDAVSYTIYFCLGDNVGGGGGIQSGVRRLTPSGFQ